MISTTIVIAIVLGMAAQVLAERFRLPAILPLLVFGMAAGPQMLGLLEPASLGQVLEKLIPLGVAVILFEGGLSLELGELKKVGGAVWNLLSIGLVVTGVGGALLAHQILGMPWTTAALFGAIVTVTGPTVIVPLLRHMIAPRQVKTILVSEGLLIDPLGAVLAYLVLRWIERAGIPPAQLTTELLILVATGAVVGFAAGSLAQLIARRRLAGGDLLNLVVLALVLLCFWAAEKTAPESGILAVVVMGVTMSGAEIPDLEPLKSFKEQLTLLLISILFILLSSQLDLDAVMELGWRGVAVVVGLILVVRPLAVLLSVFPGQLDLKGRLVLALTAPRGIVAAAVASLAARELTHAEIGGGPELEGLVYLVILVTGAWATAMAVALPRLLGYLDDPSRRRTVLVGANPFTHALARHLKDEGRTVVVVDSVRRKLDEPRQEGIEGVRGDARAAATYEKANVERDATVMLLTANDELNVLAAELVHTEFGVEHPVVALQAPSPEFGSRRRAWMQLLGGQAVDLPRWQADVHQGRARLVTVDVAGEAVLEVLEDLRESEPSRLLLICGWVEGKPRFRVDPGKLAGCERLTLVAETKAIAELEQATRRAAEAAEVAEVGDGNSGVAKTEAETPTPRRDESTSPSGR